MATRERLTTRGRDAIDRLLHLHDTAVDIGVIDSLAPETRTLRAQIVEISAILCAIEAVESLDWAFSRGVETPARREALVAAVLARLNEIP